MGDYNDQENKVDNQEPQKNSQNENLQQKDTNANQQTPYQQTPYQQPTYQQPTYQQAPNQQAPNQQTPNQQAPYQQPPYQQQYQQPQYQQQYQQPPRQEYNYQQQYQPNQEMGPKKNSGMSIASLVLGIVSLVLSCVFYLSIPVAIVGIILGILSLKGHKGGKGMAIAGLILSGLGLLTGIIVGVCFVAVYNNSGYINNWLSDLEYQYSNY